MKAKLPFRLSITLPAAATAAIALFAYFYLRIDPLLIYQSQQPVFFFDRLFWDELAVQPGGGLLWVSRLASQLFYSRPLGSLLLTVLLTAVPLFFQEILKAAAQKRDPRAAGGFLPFAWLPLPLLILLYSRYDFRLTAVLGALIALAVAHLFFRMKPRLQPFLFVIFFVPLYLLIGAPALLFAALAVVRALPKQPIAAVGFLFVAVLLPWLSVRLVWIAPLRDAFTANLDLHPNLPYRLPLLFWLAFPLLAAAYWYPTPGRSAESAAVPARKRLSAIGQAATVIFALIAAMAAPIDEAAKRLLRLDYAARRGQWEQVLKTVEEGLIHTYIGQFQANRALFHLGKLCSSMFTYEQRAGIDGLFLHESLRAAYPLSFSDLFFDLGYINEAQHWAHESLSVFGETPWNLQRLAEIYLLKGEKEAAVKCLTLLKRTVWHRRWAEEFERLLDQPPENWPQYLQIARQNMPHTDFLFIPGEPEQCLEHLLADRPTNRAAYEYMLAASMLLGKVGRLMNYTDRIEELGYRAVPRHAEEAMVLFISNVGQKNHKLPSYGISQATLFKFNQFVSIMEKYKGDKNAARPELGGFSDTYWYYALYRLKKQ